MSSCGDVLAALVSTLVIWASSPCLYAASGSPLTSYVCSVCPESTGGSHKSFLGSACLGLCALVPVDAWSVFLGGPWAWGDLGFWLAFVPSGHVLRGMPPVACMTCLILCYCRSIFHPLMNMPLPPAFANDDRIDLTGSIRTLIPRMRDYEFKPHRLTLPAGTLCLQPGCLLRLLLLSLKEEGLLRDGEDEEFCASVGVSIASAKDLACHVDNHVDFVKQPSFAEASSSSVPCPCQGGDYASLYDMVVGHVLCHDFSVLGTTEPALLQQDVGLNFRPIPCVTEHTIQRAATSVASQLGLLWPHLGLAWVWDQDGEVRLANSLSLKLSALRLPSRLRRSFTWTSGLEMLACNAKQQLLVTCLDKVSQTPCFVCARWAMQVLSDRLSSDSFSQLSEEDGDVLFAQIVSFLQSLHIPVGESPLWAYLFPTLKRHKCMQHSPSIPHDCGLCWRFISNCSKGMTTYPIGLLVSAIFTAVQPQVVAHRDELQQQVWDEHGVALRFRFSVNSWTQIPLNLPEYVPSACSFITGDVKQCFENIPLDGPDGLDKATAAYIHEGFDRAGMALFIPLDVDGLVAGKARFARATPPLWGKVRTWLCVDADLAVEMAVFYARITVIRTGQFLVLQVVGIPMGGPPCSQYCDIYLDHYEYGLACRIRQALASGQLSVVLLARAYALCIRHMYRYADDLMALANKQIFSQLMDPSSSRSPGLLAWIYPLRTNDGATILSFEAEQSIALEGGSETGHFLCLWVTLSGPRGNKRQVSFSPYNVRHGFGFTYPALTRFDSFTPDAVLRSALSTMVPYAVLGSSSLDAAFGFLCIVCDRLWANGYPRAWLCSMWDAAYLTAQELPCNERLHMQLPRLHLVVGEYIRRHLI